MSSDQQVSGLSSNVIIDRDTASRLGLTSQAVDSALYDAEVVGESGVSGEDLCADASRHSLSDAVLAINKAEAELGLPSTVTGKFAGTAQAFQDSLSSQPVLILAALIALDNFSITHMHDAAAKSRRFRVMGDHQNRLSQAFVQILQ